MKLGVTEMKKTMKQINIDKVEVFFFAFWDMSRWNGGSDDGSSRNKRNIR